jgi:putative Holliday junction resolvase
MSRILAIDFGLKRCGIAITDENNIIASPLETIDSQKLIPYLMTVIEEKGIGTIVIGDPKKMDNSDTHITANVRLFESELKELFPTINVVKYDERFTSIMASQTLSLGGAKRKQKHTKENLDKISAAILLQSYMKRNEK